MRFNAERIYRKIKRYEIISFDIFDTLVKRNVPYPADIFDVVEKEYNKNHVNNRIESFKRIRKAAERKAREKHLETEITLDEIYSLLPVSDENRKDELKKIEVNCEINYCVPNIPIVDIFRKCLKDGKVVIITSDMYLPKNVIVEILDNCGIVGYKRLYLSSSIGKKKSTGELFDYIMADLRIRGKDIIHIGDRKKSDNIIPRLKGMGSVYIEPLILNTEFLTKEDILNNKGLFPFINNSLPRYSNCSDLFRWGYETFGPLLLGFCSWIHRQIEEKGIDRAYFLARDMNLVIQIYQKLYGDKNINYLEVSRKSLRNDYIVSQNRLSAVFNTLTRRQYTIGDIIDSLDIDETGFYQFCDSEGMNMDITQKFYPTDELPDWFSKIDTKALPFLQEIGQAICYLKQHGLFETGKFAIVDIGWHGTIQNMLEKIAGKDFVGLYFGTTRRNYYDEMEMYGYWFKESDEEITNEFTAMAYILEAMLFPEVGTTIGYDVRSGEAIPIYAEYGAGNFSPIAELQDGAKTFIDEYVNAGLFELNLDSSEAIKAFQKLAYAPSLSQAKVLAKITIEDGREYTLAECRTLMFYVLHPEVLMKDYLNIRWKEGFIKQLFPIMVDPHKVNMMIKKVMRNRNNMGKQQVKGNVLL